MVVERNNHRNRDEDHNYVRPSGAMANRDWDSRETKGLDRVSGQKQAQ